MHRVEDEAPTGHPDTLQASHENCAPWGNMQVHTRLGSKRAYRDVRAEASLSGSRSSETAAPLRTTTRFVDTRLRGDVSDVIVYIDISEVSVGALDELKTGLKDLADFIEAKEPRLIAYNVYFSADGTRMTVVNVHPDSASLEYHMEVAGPLFRRFVGLVTLSSIRIYGDPSELALKQAHEKARLLGGGAVEVEALPAGFTRLAAKTNK